MVTSNMDNPPSIMEKCSCSGEAIEVQYWGDVDNEFYIAYWNEGFKRPLKWRERLRWCWRILRTGDPWADRVIVNKEQAKRIAEFLNQYSNGKKEEIRSSNT